MPFEFKRLQIPEVILIEARSFGDDRGRFLESYKMSEFATNGIPDQFVQDNISCSVRHVLRGLHYQVRPRAQGKLIMALQGQIFDVAVDIRRGSPTYGQWVGLTLSADPLQLLYIPAGFAHGFCVLSDEAVVSYKVTAEYAPEQERGIIWNDPVIGIEWPAKAPILSSRDAQLPLLEDADNNFAF